MSCHVCIRTGRLLGALVLALASAGCPSTSRPDAVPAVTFRFAMTDDSRAGGGAAAVSNGVSTAVMGAIARDLVAQGAELVLFPGDMVLGETQVAADLGSMLDTWKATMAPVYAAGIPVYTTRGNHEYVPAAHGAQNPADPSRATYLAHFPLPPSASTPPGGEAGLTYAFTYKNARFIAFDAYAGRTAAFDNRLYAPGSNQGQMVNPWVLDQVNSSAAGLTFVMAHEQLWPSITHPDCLANDPDSRDALIQALGRHHGTYLAGHDHMYVRGAMTSGSGDRAPAFVVGSGGGGNYDYAPYDAVASGYSGPARFQVQKTLADSADPIFGYLLVTVYSDNTWSAQFRGFRFNKWNDPADASLTPITVLDAFKSSDL